MSRVRNSSSFFGPLVALPVLLIGCVGPLLAGCGTPADPGPFTINFALNPDTGGCASTDCAAYEMSCGAMLSIRVTDAATGELIITSAAGGSQEAALCEPISAAGDLCGLGNLPPGSLFFDLPPRMLRIEVAAWGPETLVNAGFDGTCPTDDLFDLAGNPLTGFTPQPAFAGATYFDAGSSETSALVSLACTDPDQLDTADCAPERIEVRAGITNMEIPPTQAMPSPLPQALLVRVGGVRQVQVEDNVFFEIDSNQPISVLELEPDGSFAADLVAADVPDPHCVIVLEQTPQATTSVSCTDTAPGPLLETSGALIPRPNLEEMLAAIELDEFPSEGLIVGRVFDEDGVPLAGVTVTPMVDAEVDPNPVVEYLNSTRDDTLGTETFDNGYFIAQGVSFGTEWLVSGVINKVPAAVPRAGLIRNQVTLLPIEMRNLGQ